jgi:hypothetical protein
MSILLGLMESIMIDCYIKHSKIYDPKIPTSPANVALKQTQQTYMVIVKHIIAQNNRGY